MFSAVLRGNDFQYSAPLFLIGEIGVYTIAPFSVVDMDEPLSPMIDDN
jgi:hypothetical protein